MLEREYSETTEAGFVSLSNGDFIFVGWTIDSESLVASFCMRTSLLHIDIIGLLDVNSISKFYSETSLIRTPLSQNIKCPVQ